MLSEDRIDKLVTHLKEREKQAQEVLDTLREFTDMLYTSLEKALDAIAQKGISQSANVKKSDLSKGFKSFSFDWDDFRVVINPYLYAAYLDEKTKLKLPKEPVERIVYFFQRKSDPTTGEPMSEIYVYPNREWLAFGTIGTRIEHEISEDKLDKFALSILETLTYNFTSHHRNLKDTNYDPSPQGVSSPIGFATRKPG